MQYSRDGYAVFFLYNQQISQLYRKYFIFETKYAIISVAKQNSYKNDS